MFLILNTVTWILLCVIKTPTQKAYKAVLKTKNEMQSLQIENIISVEAWN